MAYSQPKDGAGAIRRNKYVPLRDGKPKNKHPCDSPEYKSCKSAGRSHDFRRHGSRINFPHEPKRDAVAEFRVEGRSANAA